MAGTARPTGRDVLRRTVAGQRRPVLVAAATGAAYQVAETLVPVLIGTVIDRSVSARNGNEPLFWLAALAAVLAVRSLSFRASLRTAERASQQAAHRLRTEVAARVLDDRGGARDGRLPGELANTATADAHRVGCVNLALPVAVSATAAVLVGAVVLLRISVPLGLLVLIAAPVLLGLAHLLGRPLERHSAAEQEGASRASGTAADLVRGLRTLKGIGAERAAIARYRVTSRESMTAAIRAAGAQAWLEGAMTAATGGLLALVALVGGRLALAGDITVGQLVSAVGLAQYLFWPLSVVSWVTGLLAQGRASAARIAAVLSAPAAVLCGTAEPPRPVRGELRLRNLALDTLRGVNLEVAAGELLGVVAKDPADAAALVRCLARDAEPVSGTVALDGIAVQTLDTGAVRSAVLVATHEADLFEGSLYDNVAAVADRANATGGATAVKAADTAVPDPIQRAITVTGVDEIARSLAHGTGTAITGRGRSLSGGQRQRVALARALAADPSVLVLHDPTTAVDTVTEVSLAAAIRDTRRGRTTVVVATSPALLAVADRVVLLEDGTVTAEGTHHRLLREDRYREVVLT